MGNKHLYLIPIMLVLMECFTPIAPFQRGIGLTMGALPVSVKDRLLPQHRIENLHQQISQMINTQTITDYEGNTLVDAQDEILPEYLKRIAIAVENHRFERTYVLDYPRTLRSAILYLSHGDIKGGGSGIVQQLARSFVLRDRRPTLSRKIMEFLVACELRNRHSPEELLEYYLRTVFLGGSIIGFPNAARYYYSTRLKDLQPQQLIGLVSLLDRPNAYRKDPELFNNRYRQVVQNLYRREYLSQEQHAYLIAHPPALGQGTSISLSIAHYLEHVKTLYPDHQVIHTFVDTDMSEVARQALLEKIAEIEARTGIHDVNGFIVIGSGDGRMLTLIGSKDYVINRLNFTQIKSFSPGSLMKVPIYSYFYEIASPSTPLPTAERSWQLDDGRSWHVRNYTTRFNNLITLPAAFALSRSINVPASFLALAFKDSIFNRIQPIIPDLRRYEANLLGAENVRPVDLFQLLQICVEPYGQVPNLRYTNQCTAVYQSLFEEKASHNVSLNLGLSVDDSLGTAHQGQLWWKWSGYKTIRIKTGTAQNHKSVGLFFTLPGGLSCLVGVFSESNQPLLYPGSKRGVTGSSLLSIAEHIRGLARRKYNILEFIIPPEAKTVYLESPSYITLYPFLTE